jgi:cysteinyl-tRNA synthetase
MLKIYNTLGKKLEEFKPLKEGEVSMYVCGPTVYWYLHVGNFRGPVFFNFVRNWLEYRKFKVTYALNFTDVDDKILKRAEEENKPALELSQFYIDEYKKDFAALGLRAHSHNPKVSDFMPQIISMVSELIEKKKAYETAGDVNYSIQDFKNYGELSGRKTEELLEGVRIDVHENKKNPLDFALWKSAKPGEQMSWNSPWGPGRPGWHIECSAMVKGLFGDQIDIHGGGLDLLFPHHENEIAQSEACNGARFVRYWMHVNMLNFGGAKMSKSLGNVVTMRDFLKEHHAEVYKWMILSVHYRSVADFSEEAVHRAVQGLAKFYSTMALAETVAQSDASVAILHDVKYEQELSDSWVQIEAAFDEDFGTPAAFAVAYEVIRKFNSRVRRGMKLNGAVKSQCEQFMDFIKKFGSLLSLFQEPAGHFLTQLDERLLKKLGHSRNVIEELVKERALARDAKDFSKADELRKKLTELQITVSDTPQGSFWEVIK